MHPRHPLPMAVGSPLRIDSRHSVRHAAADGDCRKSVSPREHWRVPGQGHPYQALKGGRAFQRGRAPAGTSYHAAAARVVRSRKGGIGEFSPATVSTSAMGGKRTLTKRLKMGKMAPS